MRERIRVQHPGGGESRTKQADKDAADINVIMGKYLKTGILPANHKIPAYGDFTGVGDYHAALNKIIAAQDDFLALPSEVRQHCENDPGQFLEMVFDPSRRTELEELGLVEERAPAAAPPADPQPPEPPAVVDEPAE